MLQNLTDQRLQKFTIAVGNTMESCYSLDHENFEICTYIPGKLQAAETRLIYCDQSVKGRCVTIYMDRPEVLTLCEVEVFGTPALGKIFCISSFEN